MPPPLRNAVMIDDDEVNHIAFERIVDRSQLVENLFSFENGREALDFLQTPDHPPIDIILLDVHMPLMSGLAFLEAATAELGNRFNRAFVIMLTTSLDPSDRNLAQSFDAVRAYFNKPLSYEHLAEILALHDSADATRLFPASEGSA